jgi:hypothetical protein
MTPTEADLAPLMGFAVGLPILIIGVLLVWSWIDAIQMVKRPGNHKSHTGGPWVEMPGGLPAPRRGYPSGGTRVNPNYPADPDLIPQAVAQAETRAEVDRMSVFDEFFKGKGIE